jgi:hypothetical protein
MAGLLLLAADQLAPQSCRAYRRKTADFHMGNYALTLVESLSTLAVMGEAAEFQQAVDWLSANLEWRSVEVSVFEANIRVLGGTCKLLLLFFFSCMRSVVSETFRGWWCGG